MSTKLKDLKITKVAFVDAGANPKANIMLYKSKEGKPTKTEAGTDYPAEAYAYVPDPEKPTTWKLRLWEDPDQKVTAKQVGMAVAALGQGFRGNKADIPDADKEKVKAKVLSAWKETHPDAKDEDIPAALKKESSKKSVAKRIFEAIAKALGVEDTEVEGITKDAAETFSEKMDERQKRRVADQIWDMTYALQESLMSIICDDETAADQKPTLMGQSIDEFTQAIKGLVGIWATGKVAENITKSDRPVTPERLEFAKAAKEKLEALITKNKPAPEPEIKEGENEDMKIDKSKLTPEEIATLDAIEKKAGIEEPTPQPTPAPDGVAKNAAGTVTPANGDNEDIYKGLNPAVKAELVQLHKAVDAAETKELTEIAKKYEIIGKKPEDLVPVLKNLKSTSPEAYGQMISVLDASVEAVNKSGFFSEIGKSNSGAPDAWTMIEKKADEIQTASPNMTRAQAVDKACEQNPQLVHEYESNK